ncbi:sensor histidine kinase [Gemmatimonas sp.]
MAAIAPVPGVETGTPVPSTRWRTRLAVWSVPAALGVLYAQRLGAAGEPGVPTWKLMVIALATWYVWAFVTPWVERLADGWPLRGARAVLHGGAHLVASVGFIALQALVTALASAFVGAAPIGMVPAIAGDWFVVLLPAGVVVYGAVVAFRQATVTRVRLEQRERHAEQLMLALRDAQLSVLRAQLQPHFLFNTLTAITALVRDGEADRATAALEQLSVLLRSALRASDQHEVTLREEVDRLTQYVRIEEMRLGRPLRLVTHIAPTAERALVPAWILQPLVENSVRHGLRALPASGTLDVDARLREACLVVTVRDDGAGLSADWESRAALGYGLANSRARLAALYGDRGRLDIARGEVAGTSVTVVVPFREAVA